MSVNRDCTCGSSYALKLVQSRFGRPWIDDVDACVSELAHISRHYPESASGSACGEKRIRNMIVERLATSSLCFHNAGAGVGVGQTPANDPVLELLVEKFPEPFRQVVPAAAGGKTADAVKDFPSGDGSDADSLDGN